MTVLPERKWILSVGIIIFILMGIVYQGVGFYRLIFTDSAYDLKMRWPEVQAILKGQNPYDFQKASLEAGKKVKGLDYPPWSYFTGFIFLWPAKWSLVRIYFALWNAVALGMIGFWAFRIGRERDRLTACFLCVSTLALSNFYTTLWLGQYSIIVVAILVGVYLLETKKLPFLSGLVMGFAMLKPTISIPFLFALLIKKKFYSLFISMAYITIAAVIIGIMIKTYPLEMFHRAYMASNDNVMRVLNPARYLIHAGLSAPTALLLSAITFLGAALLLMLLFVRSPLQVHFSIAAVAGRLATYHRQYDNIMILFLLVPLGYLAFVRDSKWGLAGFLLVGFSLWLPIPALRCEGFQLFQILAWILGLAIYLTEQHKIEVVREQTVTAKY